MDSLRNKLQWWWIDLSETNRYWYHTESDGVLIDNEPSNETQTFCVEITEEEYNQFKMGKIQGEKKVMTLQEMEARYAKLESEARAISMTIGQEEMRIDTALDDLRKVLPDLKFDDPSEINFEELMADVQKDIEELSAKLDTEFTELEGVVEEANAQLQNVVGSSVEA